MSAEEGRVTEPVELELQATDDCPYEFEVTDLPLGLFAVQTSSNRTPASVYVTADTLSLAARTLPYEGAFRYSFEHTRQHPH